MQFENESLKGSEAINQVGVNYTSLDINNFVNSFWGILVEGCLDSHVWLCWECVTVLGVCHCAGSVSLCWECVTLLGVCHCANQGCTVTNIYCL